MGFLLIIVGIAFTLSGWHELFLVFQALMGPVLAIVGLVMMFAASMKNKVNP